MTDTLVVRLSEDAWNGDAQFTLDVDGVQIAGPTSVTTAHGSGFQEFAYTGDFGAVPHTVAVHFINDAWGGSATTDRNLYVGGITFNGQNSLGETATNDAMGGQPDADPNAAEMYVNGTVTFSGVGTGSTIIGTDGNDTLIGTAGNDHIDGLGGDDTINGQGGNDTINGGPGNNRLTGGPGVDLFLVQSQGNPSSDLITDFVAGTGTGHEVVNLDGFTYGSSAELGNQVYQNALGVHVTLDHGQSVEFAGLSITTLNRSTNFLLTNVVQRPEGEALIGTAGDNTLVGTDWNDNINGNDGNDIIQGGFGDDILFGGAGNDTIMGGNSLGSGADDGRDTIDGGPGNDILSGGPQALFRVVQGNGSDTIVGYDASGSRKAEVDLYGTGFTSFDDVGAHTTYDDNAGITTVHFNNGETLTFRPSADTTLPHAAIRADQINFSVFLFGAPPPPESQHTVSVFLSEDAFQGDAQFTLDVEGNQIMGPRSVEVKHGNGFQEFTFTGIMRDAPAAITVHFINDAYGGSPDTDRNLYVGGITFDGTSYPGQTAQNTAMSGGADTDPHAAEMYANGSVIFSNVGGSSPPPPPPSGTSTIVLHMSEDAYQGDAQFLVFVDGVQQGSAVRSVTAAHGVAVQDITLTGNFGTQGPGTIDIQFINDFWGGSSSADRNLYVQSIDVNGVHFQGNTATNNAANGAEATDPTAAVMAVNGVAEFHIDHSAPPQIMG